MHKQDLPQTAIEKNLMLIHRQIQQACIEAQRSVEGVTLLAVSKKKSAQVIAEAYRAGQRHFGENYCQEGLTKQAQLSAFAITWHFIGPIQSNKTKAIAENFDWVHSVDSLKIARRLSAQRPPERGPLTICLQVNISEEHSKSGVRINDLPALCLHVAELPNIRLRGVMAIPAPEVEYERQRQPYRKLVAAVKALHRPELTAFSFGMSGDLRAAIVEGATLVRIGTALFGER